MSDYWYDENNPNKGLARGYTSPTSNLKTVISGTDYNEFNLTD